MAQPEGVGASAGAQVRQLLSHEEEVTIVDADDDESAWSCIPGRNRAVVWAEEESPMAILLFISVTTPGRSLVVSMTK